MSNQFYDSIRAKFLEGQVNLVGMNVKIALLDSTYVGGNTAITTHTSYADIASHVIPGTTTVVSLTNKTSSKGGVSGAYGADNVIFTAPNGGVTVGFFVIFVDEGSTVDGAPSNQNTATLIALIDSGYGIGSGTNGGNFEVTWDPRGIFRI